MRTIITILIIAAFAPFSVTADSEESLTDELALQLELIVCNETLYSCSESSPRNCSAMADEAFSHCASSELNELAELAVEDETLDDIVASKAGDLGQCFLDKFRTIAARDSISDACVSKAALASIEEQKAEAKKALENR